MSRQPNVKTVHVCQVCGYRSPRWLGRCSECSEWGSMVEETAASSRKGRRSEMASAAPIKIAEVAVDEAKRFPSGLIELDRVLGGGIVPGAVILLGGDPGIGKSTLLMQALAAICHGGQPVLYLTGEESASQVALRARRLDSPSIDEVALLATTELEVIEMQILGGSYAVVVVDSVQTMRVEGLGGAIGSAAQLREVAARIVEAAKRSATAVVLIGHITKDGAIAGPKALEHLVDVVLSFEGDRSHAFRLVRAEKNRFGPAQEVGVFEMTSKGLEEVPDPSALFLAERPANTSGSIVVPTIEGSRALLLEIQALVAPPAYGTARRVATGLDSNRLAILLAVLERKAGMHVLDRDVFASVAGGARIVERASDLALVLAVASSMGDWPVPSRVVAFGEIGLAGEVRAVPRAAQRLAEARKLGFESAILPRENAERLERSERRGLELHVVDHLHQAIEATRP